MSSPGKAPSPSNRSQYFANLSIAGVAGQVGCVTVIIVFGALFAGIWLDRWLNTRPLFTVGLLLGSVPVTLAVMVWLVKSVVSKIQPADSTPKQTQEDDSGE
jgi:F0F1-type ATP synthase assembly protein I